MKKAKKLIGRGGAGRGQGRKNKYGEPTELRRVPVSMLGDLDRKLQQAEQKAGQAPKMT